MAELLSPLPPARAELAEGGCREVWGTQDVARAPLGTAGHRRVERHRLPGHLAGGTHGWGSGTGSELGENTVSSSHEQTTDIRGVGVRHARGSPKSRAPTAPLSNPCCLCVSTTTKKRHFFFRRPPAKRGFGRAGAAKGLALPARHCPHPSKGIRAPAGGGITGITADRAAGAPGAAARQPESQQPGFSLYPKQSEYSAKQREREPTASLGGSVRDLQPSSIPAWGGIRS